MKKKKTILICILAFSLLGLSILTIATLSKGRVVANQHIHTSPIQPKTDPPGTIYGNKNPELIPDKISYDLFFRSLVSTNGISGSYNLPLLSKVKKSTGISEEATSKLMKVIDTYQLQVSILDQKAKEIKDQYWPEPTPIIISQLADLQSQKDELVISLMNSLSDKVGKTDGDKVHKHITTEFKKDIKIAPDPIDYPTKWGK